MYAAAAPDASITKTIEAQACMRLHPGVITISPSSARASRYRRCAQHLTYLTMPSCILHTSGAGIRKARALLPPGAPAAMHYCTHVTEYPAPFGCHSIQLEAVR